MGKNFHKKKNIFMNLELTHFNCQGLASEERLLEFENAIGGTNLGIIGLAEMKSNSEKIIKIKNGNIFYYYGTPTGYRGVGFYVNKKLTDHILNRI